MIGSLYSGLSGIQNHQKKLEVIGNNISNVNTMGFKSGRVLFSDAISQNLEDARAGDANKGGVNPQQIGAGVQIKTVDNNFSQGALKETGVRTDLAFDGRGFFVLSDGSTQHYTRSGAFDIDEQGFLVDSGTGMIVQGKIANDEGVIETGTSIEDIQLKFGDKIPAKATTEVEFASNLDARGSENVIIGDTAFKKTITRSDAAFTTNTGAAAEISIQRSDVNTPIDYSDPTTFTTSDSTEINDLDQVTTDLSDGDTITISDGTNPNVTFTYGDPATDPTYDGTNLGDLVAKVNIHTGVDSDGNTTTRDADVDENGNIEMDSIVSDFSMTFNDEDGDGSRLKRPQFSDTPVPTDETTAINDLDQVTTDLVDGDTIAITGTDSTGASIPNTTFTYGAANDGVTLQDLLDKIGGAYVNSTASMDNNGNIVLTPPDNADSETSLLLTTPDPTGANPNTGVIDLPKFNFEGYKYDTSFTVYDSEGHEHNLTMVFEKLSEFSDPNNENKWSWEINIPNVDIREGTDTGTITFNSDGSLKNFSYTGGQSATALQFDPGNGAGLVSIDLDTGTEGKFDGITQFASESNVAVRSQDGYSMGMLQDFDIDEQGMITGIFTNGLSRTQAQLTVADFNNPSGLVKEGDSYYQPSANSGQAVLGEAGTGGLGKIQSRTLELSNVDLANQFTKLVIAQRGFQANSNVITTTDTLFADLMRLKRA